MAKKMYYTEEEAAEKLGIPVVALSNLVSEQKLRVFKDGARNMYRATEVETLAEQGVQTEEEIELTPADTSSSSSISLADSTQVPPAGKEDTVITAEGVSVFDEKDQDVETADPMAKTQITMNMEDQVAMDGSGSGSGLLDLTRESDDTSLGEVLERIEMNGSSAVSPITEEVVAAPAAEQPAGPVMVTAPDPLASLFGGLALGAAAVAIVIGAVMLATMTRSVPDFLEFFEGNKAVVLLGGLVIIGVAGALMHFLGKGTSSAKGTGGA